MKSRLSEHRSAGIAVAAATLMRMFLRIFTIGALAIALAQTTEAQNASGLLNVVEVQRLVVADSPPAHAALARHFIALTHAYRTDAARYTALAKAYVGNPNHPTNNVGASWMRKAEDATANANAVRTVTAYHQILSLGRTSHRPAGAAAFDGGKGAPPPTRAELDQLARAARTPSAHRELAEYYLIVSHTETVNAEAYARTAQMTRVSGARNTEAAAARFERLAGEAREAARQADLAVELHRQLALIG